MVDEVHYNIETRFLCMILADATVDQNNSRLAGLVWVAIRVVEYVLKRAA